MADHMGWQGILDDEESILWQGRPEKGIRWFDGDVSGTIMGIFMVCFALFWMFKAAESGTLMWIFGFLFLLVGGRQALAGNVIPAYIRSQTWYTLTNRRAIIATDMPVRGRRLTTVPITPDTLVTYEPASPGSILFGPPIIAQRRNEAFLLIPDAERVMRLIRKIQTEPPVLTSTEPTATEPTAKDAP